MLSFKFAYFTVFYQVQPLVVKVAMKAKQSVPFYDALLVSIMLNSNGRRMPYVKLVHEG